MAGIATTRASVPAQPRPQGQGWGAGPLKLKGWSVMGLGAVRGPTTAPSDQLLGCAGPVGWGGFPASSQSIWGTSAQNRFHVKAEMGCWVKLNRYLYSRTWSSSFPTDVSAQGQAVHGDLQTQLTTEPQATVEPALGNTAPNEWVFTK